MKKLMLSGILALVLLPLAGQTIDLSASSWYFRSGFSRVWIDAVPAITDSAWKVIQAPGGKTTMAIRDLGISGVPAVFRWNPLPAPAVSVCVLIPFTVSESFLEVTDPALLLAQVGQSWSIYLNGSHMYSEMNRDSSDSYIDKSERKALIPLDAAMLKKGLNILAIHVMGDPGNERMGFNLKSPYVIDSYQVLAKNKQEYVDIVLISIYAIFALYNIVLFLLRPKEKSYLFFGLATLMLSTYLGSRTFFLTALVNDTMASNSLEVVALFCILPLFLAFFDLVLKRKIALVTMLFSGFYLLLIVPALILRSEPFMALWLLSTPVFILYFLVFVLGRTIVAETGVMLQAIRDTGFRGLIRAFRRFNAENDAGKIMVGTLIFIAAAIFDMIRVLNGQDLFLVKYSFVFFIMGVATMQAGKVLTIYASLENLNAGLEHTVIERTSALAGATAERKRLNAKILESNRELQSAIEESGRDMSMAVSVQKGFFPAVAPKVAGWDIALIFEPAAGVSGDLYDFYTNGDELNGVLVGDVSGMGIASGLITLLARSIFFRKLKDAEIIGLPEKIFAVNKELVRELSSVGNNLACALLWVDGNRVEYVNAGHPDALLRHAGKSEALLLLPKEAAGFKLGAFGRNQLEETVVPLRFALDSGDAVILYTDALVNGRNSKGEPYGIERLRHSFRRADMETAQTILSSITIDYRGFIGRMARQDDLTLVVLKKT